MLTRHFPLPTTRTRVFIKCLAIACVFFASSASANLIPNPGFETYSALPTAISQPHLAVPWINPSTAGTSDYYHANATPASMVGTPTNIQGTQAPHGGDAYAGLYTVVDPGANYREYIESSLLSPLVANQQYKFSFHVSLAEESFAAVSELGAFFSVGSVAPVPNFLPLPFTPQVVNTTGALNNQTGWTLVQGTFTAAGGEDHVVIGNFKDDASTVIFPNPSDPTQTYPLSYYYIDDASLVAVPEPATLAVLGLLFVGRRLR